MNAMNMSARSRRYLGHSLALDLLELVDLVGHLVDGILLLLAEARDLGFALQLLFLKIAAEFQQFLFALLVHIDLELQYGV